MPKSMIEAARHLVEVLDRENTALVVMDLRRATMLLPEKTAAIAALSAAEVIPHPDVLSVARRLDDLALENRRLLERAIVAQRRVIGIVVRAAAAASTGPAYQATGHRASVSGPMTLSTRA
jgi:flagellar biosynthesis/type III secretory pathway chaperone